MTSHQDALNRLSKYEYETYVTQRESSFNDSLLKEDVNLIQELVDRATPKKPKRKLIVNELDEVTGIYICSSCKWTCRLDYCEHCGQAIDWSES